MAGWTGKDRDIINWNGTLEAERLTANDGTIEKVPVNNSDIANKKYVDDNTGSLWEVDGTETQLKTADDIDMRYSSFKNIQNMQFNGGSDSILTFKDIEANAFRIVDAGGRVYINLDSNLKQVGIEQKMDLNLNKISFLGAPASDADASTKKYVDDSIKAISFHPLKTTANQTINAGAATFTDITNLTFAVTAGVDYAFYFYITFQSALATTGWKAGVNHPGGTLDFWAGSPTIANGAAGVATHTERHNTVVDDMTLLTSTVTASVDLNVRIEGRYNCTTTGTFAARFANELAADTNIVVQKGSWGWWF